MGWTCVVGIVKMIHGSVLIRCDVAAGMGDVAVAAAAAAARVHT